MIIRTKQAEEIGYDAAKDLEYVEYNILYILLVLGLDNLNIDDFTIDELVLSIREQFPISQTNDFTSGASTLKSIHIDLVSNLRRLWHARQVIRTMQ